MDKSHSFGQRWGGYLGSKAGEMLGGLAQQAFSAITGLGDYSVRKNVFAHGRLPSVVNNNEHGGVVIRFEEYLTDIKTSATAGAFTIQHFLINAANPVTFPFLSQVAANYEQYEVQGLLFQFRSTSANALNSTNTALGSVMMATQYDVGDDTFASKTEMLNYEYSTSCKPSENCIHMIECEPRQTSVPTLYTLWDPEVPTGYDPRLYHLGRFCIATTGFQGTSVNIGELHVTYQVRLLKPKLFATMGFLSLYYLSTIDLAVGYSNAAPLGTAAGLAARVATTNMSETPTFTGTVISLPASNLKRTWRMELMWYGNGGTPITRPTVTYANATAITNSQYLYAPENGETTTRVSYVEGFTTDGTGNTATITLAGATLPNPAASGFQVCRLIQVSNDYGQ